MGRGKVLTTTRGEGTGQPHRGTELVGSTTRLLCATEMDEWWQSCCEADSPMPAIAKKAGLEIRSRTMTISKRLF